MRMVTATCPPELLNMRKAFTLIELLVVIAIIAILAAILFPVFAQAKMAAKKTQSLTNLKQMTIATLMYVGDYDDLCPLGVTAYKPSNKYTADFFYPVPYTKFSYGTSGVDVDKREAAATSAFNAILPYSKNDQIFQCPGANRKRTQNFTLDPAANNAPDTLPKGLPYISYTYNGLLQSWSTTAISSVAELPVWWHGQGHRATYGHGYTSPFMFCDDLNAPCVYQTPRAGCANGNGEFSSYTTRTQRGGSAIFGRGIIMAYADGHAKIRNLAVPGTTTLPPTPQTDPRVDPFASYYDGRPSGRWYDANFCHPYMFRPDFDFSNEPAYFLSGGTEVP